MQTLRFKTNLKCKGCIDAIKPGMESIKEIIRWRVFLDVEEKTLEVDFDDANIEQIETEVKSSVIKSGYNIEKI